MCNFLLEKEADCLIISSLGIFYPNNTDISTKSLKQPTARILKLHPNN